MQNIYFAIFARGTRPGFWALDRTAGFLIHGRRARIFGQIFDQVFGQVFDQGFWPAFFDQKIQCTVLLGRKNTVLQYYRDGKKT